MEFGRRPWWMNALFALCLFMTFAYLPRDLFWTPVADDQEVWFGILLRGWAAKAMQESSQVSLESPLKPSVSVP